MQEAAEGTWAAPACLGSADPTGEDFAPCWMLNLVEIAGFSSRAAHQQRVLPVPLCLAASLELMLEKNTAASVDAQFSPASLLGGRNGDPVLGPPLEGNEELSLERGSCSVGLLPRPLYIGVTHPGGLWQGWGSGRGSVAHPELPAAHS